MQNEIVVQQYETRCQDVELSSLLNKAIIKIETMDTQHWEQMSDAERSSILIPESHTELDNIAADYRKRNVDCTIFIRAGECSTPDSISFTDQIYTDYTDYTDYTNYMIT